MSNQSETQRQPIRLEEYSARLMRHVHNWFAILRLWLVSLRAWLNDRLRKCYTIIQDQKCKLLLIWVAWFQEKRTKVQEQWLEPVRPWVEAQRSNMEQRLHKGNKIVRPWLEETHSKLRGFVSRRREQIFQLSIFLNVFLLLLRVTTLQMGYIQDYRVDVASQDYHSNVTNNMRGARQAEDVSRLAENLPELPPLVPGGERDLSSPLSNTMQDGCLAWEGPPTNTQAILSAPSPTGLIVNVLLSRDQLDYVCGFFPTQMEHFIVPQGLDVLFVLPTENGAERITKEEMLQCLNLKHQLLKSETEWTNLDNTYLKTYEYSYDFLMTNKRSTGKKSPSVFLAETQIELPHYVRVDPSLLQGPLENGCSAPLNYIQGARWYTNEMLHLGILQRYEYFVKLDMDVAFLKPLPFDILRDMKLRGAVFGHTAAFPDSTQMPCGEEITSGIRGFELGWQMHSGESGPGVWKGTTCSEGHPRMNMGGDHYYTNLIIGRTDYFQRNEVRVLGKFLSEFNNGFFKHRWTDQIFWHFALGLFIDGPDKNYETSGAVADYTDFRCAPLQNCWLSFFDQETFPSESDQCRNGGSFVHTRALSHYRKGWSQISIGAFNSASRRPVPYESTYTHECPPNV